MQDDFIARASTLIEELRSDIAGIDKVIQEAEAAKSKYREKLHLYEEALATYRQVMELPTTPHDQLPLVGTLRGTIADMCAQVMELRKGPVPVGELVKILTAAGRFRDAKNYRGNYGTVFGTLQRDERFGKVRAKGVFYLMDRNAESPLFAQRGGPGS